MSLSLSVTSPSGHKAELRVVVAASGDYIVKAAGHVTPKLLSPFITIATFVDEDDAEYYANRLKQALEEVPS